LSLSLFPWAPFRSTKAAVKMHTLLDLRGNIPNLIHISDGKLHDVNILDQLIAEARAFYVMERGYIDFQRLYRLHQAASFFVTRAKRNMDVQRRHSQPVDRSTGIIFRSTARAAWISVCQGLSAKLSRHPVQGPRNWQTLAVHHQQHRAEHLCSQQGQMPRRVVFSLGKNGLTHKVIFRYLGERSEGANLDRRVRLRAHRDHQEAPQPVRENPAGYRTFEHNIGYRISAPTANS
jgi:hypothetical protein